MLTLLYSIAGYVGGCYVWWYGQNCLFNSIYGTFQFKFDGAKTTSKSLRFCSMPTFAAIKYVLVTPIV